VNLPSIGFTGAEVLTATTTPYGLSTATPVNQRAVFRRTFGLRISTGGLADQVRFDSAAAHFSVEFAPRQLDIAGTNAVEVGASGGALQVTVAAPVQVRRARLTGGSTATVELYRLDGDKIVEDSKRSCANTTGASFGDDFTDLRFALKVRRADATYESLGVSDLKDLVVRGVPTAPRIGIANAAEGADTAFFFVNPGGIQAEPTGATDYGPQLATALQQHIDALEQPYPEHIDILLVFESDAPCDVIVTSFAIPVALVRTSFRSLLFKAADFPDPASFATRLREHSTPLPAYLRGKLSPGTQNALDRAGRSVAPGVLDSLARDLNLALQSEAFYTAQRFQGVTLTPETLAAALANPTGVARARVNRKLLEEAFGKEIAPIPGPSGDEKEVLRAQGATSTLEVTVDFPRGATVTSASITLEADLRGDAPGTAGEKGVGPANGADWHEAIPDEIGLGVDTGRSIARLIALDNALDASGIALALSATSAAAELTAEIRADEQNTPAGRVIASGKATLERLDRPDWIHFAFKKAAIVEAKPHWLVLRATNGAAVWLAAAGSATTRVGDSLEKGWNDRGGFDTVAPLFQVWSRAAESASAGQNGGSGDALATRLRVTVGGTSVAPTPTLVRDSKKRVLDITAALQAWLAAQPSSPAIVSVPISVATLGKGSVTVYPPEIEYSI
jgi:hypothetical protein